MVYYSLDKIKIQEGMKRPFYTCCGITLIPELVRKYVKSYGCHYTKQVINLCPNEQGRRRHFKETGHYTVPCIVCEDCLICEFDPSREIYRESWHIITKEIAESINYIDSYSEIVIPIQKEYDSEFYEKLKERKTTKELLNLERKKNKKVLYLERKV